MRRIIKASMEDRSSMERFQFSLRCAVCGFLWESQPVCFSKAGMQPESEGKRVIFSGAVPAGARGSLRVGRHRGAGAFQPVSHLQTAGL